MGSFVLLSGLKWHDMIDLHYFLPLCFPGTVIRGISVISGNYFIIHLQGTPCPLTTGNLPEVTRKTWKQIFSSLTLELWRLSSKGETNDRRSTYYSARNKEKHYGYNGTGRYKVCLIFLLLSALLGNLNIQPFTHVMLRTQLFPKPSSSNQNWSFTIQERVRFPNVCGWKCIAAWWPTWRG
jgi:hypothetical protein